MSKLIEKLASLYVTVWSLIAIMLWVILGLFIAGKATFKDDLYLMNSVGFDNIFGEELLEISPVDAAKMNVKTGDIVKATSRRGTITLKAWVTERSAPGVAWCAFHFAEACGNVLTIDRFDSVTETAEYKACAIKIEKVKDGNPIGIGTVRQARP